MEAARDLRMAGQAGEPAQQRRGRLPQLRSSMRSILLIGLVGAAGALVFSSFWRGSAETSPQSAPTAPPAWDHSSNAVSTLWRLGLASAGGVLGVTSKGEACAHLGRQASFVRMDGAA
jgi:hypothetical protein